MNIHLCQLIYTEVSTFQPLSLWAPMPSSISTNILSHLLQNCTYILRTVEVNTENLYTVYNIIIILSVYT